nr:hypothetical protein [uncultured Flavobacterium sp.]
MKKISFYLMMIVLSLCIVPTQAWATEKPITTTTENPKEIPAEVKVLLNRLEEIKAMDKSELKSSERKELRKEVRKINAELRSTGNGIYISVGAIIIILLLIIIL